MLFWKYQIRKGTFGINSKESISEMQKVIREDQRELDQEEADFVDEENMDLLEYEMESDEFLYEEVKESELFGIKKYRDSTYKGEILNRLREGRGVIIYESGRVYEGYWHTDKRHGSGYE